MYDQPIVERKDSSPLGTSLLGVAAFCLIFASVLLCRPQGVLCCRGFPTGSARSGA